MTLLLVLALIVVLGRFDTGLPGQKPSWWAHRSPLPSNPFEMTYRFKDQVDLRYLAYSAVVVPLWRKVTKPWRYPFCKWPVKCDQKNLSS
jgi:hypothetical protein